MKLGEFGKEIKTRNTFGDYLDWRNKGKLFLWLHPKAEVGKRIKLILPVPITDDNDDKKIGFRSRFYTGTEDIAHHVLQWLKEDCKKMDDDETIFKIKHGSNTQKYCKGDLIKAKGYEKNFKNRILDARTEYLFCVVDNDDVEKGLQLLTLTGNAGEKLWDALISDLEEGNFDPETDDIADFLAENPIALRLKYDKEARPADKYKAGVSSRTKMTDEVAEILAKEPLDVMMGCDPDLEDTTDGGSTYAILKRMCVVDCPMLSADVKEETQEDEEVEAKPEEEKPKETKKKKKKQKAKSSNGVPKDEPKDEPDEVKAEHCIQGNKYIDDEGDTLEFMGLNDSGNLANFKDLSDGELYNLELNDILKPVREAKSKKKKKQNQTAKCSNCGHGLKGDEKECPGCGADFDDTEKIF